MSEQKTFCTSFDLKMFLSLLFAQMNFAHALKHTQRERERERES